MKYDILRKHRSPAPSPTYEHNMLSVRMASKLNETEMWFSIFMQRNWLAPSLGTRHKHTSLSMWTNLIAHENCHPFLFINSPQSSVSLSLERRHHFPSAKINRKHTPLAWRRVRRQGRARARTPMIWVVAFRSMNCRCSKIPSNCLVNKEIIGCGARWHVVIARVHNRISNQMHARVIREHLIRPIAFIVLILSQTH